MKRIIIFLALALLLIQSVSAGFNYKIEMHYSNGEISVKNVNVEFSRYNPENYFNEKYLSYGIRVSDFVENFSLRLLQSTDVYDNQTGLMSGEGVQKLNESDFYIEIPYDSNAKEIQIMDLSGNVLVKKSVIEFSRNFNYEEYQANLNKVNKSENNANTDGLCKENCSENLSIIEQNKDISIVIVIILLLVLLGLLVYYLIKSNKKR